MIRRPCKTASAFLLEVRSAAQLRPWLAGLEGRRPGWWPFILRASLREHLRMTGRDLCPLGPHITPALFLQFHQAYHARGHDGGVLNDRDFLAFGHAMPCRVLLQAEN